MFAYKFFRHRLRFELGSENQALVVHQICSPTLIQATIHPNSGSHDRTVACCSKLKLPWFDVSRALRAELVIHLLKPVIALIIAPVHEDGPMIDAWAMISPPFKPYVGRGEGGGGRSLPGEVTLGPIGAKDDRRTAIAVAITPGFTLSCIPDVKDANGPNEIEIRSADVDICAILNEAQGIICRGEVI